MNIEQLTKQLEKYRSKQNILIVADYIIKNPDLLNLLFQIICDQNNEKKWIGAWALDHIHQKEPKLVEGYIDKLILIFKETDSTSVQRIFGKILSLYNINDKVDGDFINLCFNFIESEEIPVAVKVHAMQLLFNISSKYPELKQELRIIIEEHIPNNTVGFKSRANKLLKKL